MEKRNTSIVTEFILLGLSEDPKVQMFLFVLFLVIYVVTITGNLFLITACIRDPHLHTPMYFFLANLSFIDICYSSVIVPNLLNQLIVSRRMSFSGCALQMYTYLLLACTESMVLAIMAYDCYVAITFPFQYTVIISQSVCRMFISCSWISGSVLALLSVVYTLQLPLCGNNVIQHFFCEATTFLKMSCVGTFIPQVMFVIVAIFSLMAPTLVILISYIRIVITVIVMPSSEGRYKAFSTCASHLTVVTMAYGSAMSLYLKPVSKTANNQDKAASLFYTVMPALLNPMIYSLRNKDVKMALRNVIVGNIPH
ncbi:olfactory receptor 2D3-like [Lissotriton helveticus]